MSAHVLQPAVLAALMLVGALAAAPAQAGDPLPAKSMLGRAQSSAERESLESLLSKLEAGQRPPRPRHVDEAARAEELAKELAREPMSTPTTSGRSDPITIPPAAETAPKAPDAVTANSFAFPKALGGQPVGRHPPAEPAAPPPPAPLAAVPSTPPAAPALPPVAPGIHLSPGPLSASHTPGSDALRTEPEGPRARLPDLPRLPAPLPKAAATRDASLTAVDAPQAGPGAAAKKTPPTASARRGLCTEILQRATLGELTEEDRAILRTQSR